MPPGFHQPPIAIRFWGGGLHHAFGLRGALSLALLVVVLIIAVVALVLSISSRARRSADAHPRDRDADLGSEALRVLDERFARGDIGAEDYTTRRSLLRGSVPKG